MSAALFPIIGTKIINAFSFNHSDMSALDARDIATMGIGLNHLIRVHCAMVALGEFVQGI